MLPDHHHLRIVGANDDDIRRGQTSQAGFIQHNIAKQELLHHGAHNLALFLPGGYRWVISGKSWICCLTMFDVDLHTN